MKTEEVVLSNQEKVLSLYPTAKIHQKENALKYLEAIMLRNEENLGARRISQRIDVNEGTINYWIMGRSTPRSLKGIKELESMNLLPLKISDSPHFRHFMRTLGLRYSDGCIYEQKRNQSFTFYVCFSNKNDALRIVKDSKEAWGINQNIHCGSRAHYIYLPASLGRLVLSVGSPKGNKTRQAFKLPKWIFNLNNILKFDFLDGLFSGDGDSPRLKPSGKSSESLRISLNSEESVVNEFCNNFMKDIQKLILSLNIKASEPKIMWNQPRVSKEGVITYPVSIRILTKKENMIGFLENIEYRYVNKGKNSRISVLNALKETQK